MGIHSDAYMCAQSLINVVVCLFVRSCVPTQTYVCMCVRMSTHM